MSAICITHTRIRREFKITNSAVSVNREGILKRNFSTPGSSVVIIFLQEKFKVPFTSEHVHVI